MSSSPSDHPGAGATWARDLGLGVVLAAVVTVIVLAFSWPSATASPRDLPIGITGQGAQATAAVDAIEGGADGAIELMPFADRDAAVEAIRQREVYGAVVLGAAPEVLTSTAANPAVAQVLDGVATHLRQAAAAAAGGEPTTPAVRVSDVVPLLDSDPRGTGLTAAALPLVLGGLLGGALISLAVAGVWRRVAALAVYAAAAGLLVAGVLQGWLDVLAGSYALNAAAFALSLLAVGAPIVGFAALLGRRGIALGPVLFLLVANPISGATVPKEFLPGPWGEIGQWFPPGAGATLLRDLSYFPDADPAFPWLVLATWAAGGLLLAGLAQLRTGLSRRGTAGRQSSSVPEPATV